MCVELEYCRDK